MVSFFSKRQSFSVKSVSIKNVAYCMKFFVIFLISFLYWFRSFKRNRIQWFKYDFSSCSIDTNGDWFFFWNQLKLNGNRRFLKEIQFHVSLINVQVWSDYPKSTLQSEVVKVILYVLIDPVRGRWNKIRLTISATKNLSFRINNTKFLVFGWLHLCSVKYWSKVSFLR